MEQLKGLQVPNQVDIELLRAIKKGQRRSSLLNMLIGSSRPPNLQHNNVEIIQVHHRFTAIVSDNYVQLYEMELAEDGTVKCQLLNQVETPKKITLCVTNWNTSVVSNIRTYLAVAMENTLFLYVLDLKSKKFVRKADTSIKDIRTIAFMGENRFLVMTKSNQLIKYDCTSASFSRKLTIKTNLSAQEHGDITASYFLCNTAEEQDELFYYFFVTMIQEEDLVIEKIFIKELMRRGDTIEEGELFPVNEVDSPHSIFQKVKVVRIKDCFCAIIEGEIQIIRKKYNDYYFFDSILRKSESQTVTMVDDGTIFSIGNKQVELNKLILGDLKCQPKTVDVVYFDEIPPNYIFKSMASYSFDKTISYCMFFVNKEDQSKVKFLTMVRVEAFKKLLDLVRINEPLSVVQQLGEHLGISKKDFYLKLWSLSKRELPDVNDKLLETEDVPSIKREMKFFLRRKRIKLLELKKVYIKLLQLIKSKLKFTLDRKLLKDYIKTHFMVRKLKIQPDMLRDVGFNEFMEIRKKGIVEILQSCIINEKQLSAQAHNTKQREKTTKMIQKEQTIMRDVLSEFRVVLLEDYQKFLQHLLAPFSQDILSIVNKFNFILPRHPYVSEFRLSLNTKNDTDTTILNKSIADLAGSAQPKIFSPVKEIQWDLELTRERLIAELSQNNLTSSVTAAIDNFVNSPFFTKNRLINHGMIPLTRDEYISKISRNSGTRLFLKVCEYANISKPNESTPKNLVANFHLNNNLCDEDLVKVTFYSSLHLFMQKYNVGNGLCMDKLLSLSEEDLIALFFLGDEQKHDLILRELRTLYEQPLMSKNNLELSLFDSVMFKFVSSENCSPVQIKLLTQSIKQMGPQFQQSNQPLIQIIIDGFCQRLQVREQDNIDEFVSMFSEIQLSLQLNEKMMRILKIKELAYVFEHFHCDKESVQLVEREGKLVLSRVLQNYFLQDIQGNSITVDQQFISLDTPRNMLNILLFLQEKLYPEVNEWQVLIIFGERMIDYEVFDILNDIIHQDNTLALLDVDVSEYTQTLIRNTLEKIYNEESISSFQSVREHMYNILHLQKQKTPYYCIEEARIRLCELITESDFEITPSKVYNIKVRAKFMCEFIQKGYETLTLNRLFEIYSCFQTIAEETPEQYDPELLMYLQLFAKTLKQNDRIMGAVQVLTYLIEQDCLQKLYPLVTETLIRALMIKHPKDFPTARKYLQAYSFHFQSKALVTDMFKCQFQSDKADNFIQQGMSTLTVHPSLTFLSWREIVVELDSLQKLSRELVPGDGDSPEFFRYYYFMITVLSQPEKGFNIVEISYECAVLEVALDKMGGLLNSNSEMKSDVLFNNFNEYEMRKLFLNGLWAEASVRTAQEPRMELDVSRLLDEDVNFINVTTTLKEWKEDDIVRMMHKCQRYLIDNKGTYLFKLKKAQNYATSLQKNINVKEEAAKPLAEEVCSKSFVENRLNKTMTLAEFREDTMNMTAHYPNLKSPEIMSMVWDNASRKKGTSPNQKRTEQIIPSQILDHDEQQNTDNVLPPQQQNDENLRNQIFSLFDDNKFYEIQQLPRDDLLKYMREYYYSDRPIKDIIKLMQAAKVGEERNIKIVQSALRVKTPIDLKNLFQFQYYFFVPQVKTQRDSIMSQDQMFYAEIFNYLEPILRDLVTNENALELGKIIYISLKYDKEYEHKVHFFALQKLLNTDPPEPNMKPQIQQYLSKLFTSTKFIITHYAEIIDSCATTEARQLISQRLLDFLRLRRPQQLSGPDDEQPISSAIADIQSRQYK